MMRFRHFLFLFLLIPKVSWGFDPSLCGHPILFQGLLATMAPTICHNKYAANPNNINDEPEFCKCVKEEMEKNIFLKAKWQDKKDIEDYNKEKRSQFTDKFIDMYKENLFTAEYQKTILFSGDRDWDPKAKVQACTPKYMSERFSENSLEFIRNQKEEFRKQIQAKEKERVIQQCDTFTDDKGEPVGDCKTIIKQIDEWKKYIAKPDADLSSEHCTSGAKGLAQSGRYFNVPVIGAAGALQVKSNNPALNKIQEMIDWYSSKDDSWFTKNKINKEQKLRALETKKKEITSKVTNGLIKDFESGCGNTSSPDGPFKELYSQYLFDNVDNFSECSDVNDPLCEKFNEANEIINSEIFDKMKKTDNSYCFSYPEYLTLQSLPGDKLLKAFKERSAEEIAKLLEPPKFSGRKFTPLEEERIKFLNSNPLLSKLSGTEDAKIHLGRALKNRMGPGKLNSENEKLGAFLDFMKQDLKPFLLADGRKAEKAVCDELADFYSAVQVSDYFPPETKPSDSSGEDANSRFLKCQILDKKETSVADFQKTLDANRLYQISNTKVFGSENQDDAFKKFNEDHCKGFGQHVKDKCKYVVDEACRQSFRGRKDITKLFDNKQITTNITETHAKAVARITQSRYNDNEFEASYNNDVRKHQKRNFIAYKGQEAKFDDNKAHNDEVLASAKFPAPSAGIGDYASISGRDPASSNSYEIEPNSAQINDNQQNPPWLKAEPKPVTAGNIQNANSVQEFLANNERLSKEEMESDRKRVSNQVNDTFRDLISKTEDDDEKEMLIKKQEKFNQELKEQKEKDKKLLADPKRPDFSTTTNVAGTSAPGRESVAGMSNFAYAGPFNQIGSSNLAARYFAPVAGNKSKGINEALLSTKYKEVGPWPETSAGLVLQDYPASEKEMEKAKDRQELELTDSEFTAVWGSQEKLYEFLAAKIDPLKESVVTLKSPGKEPIKVHIQQNGKKFTARVKPKFSRDALIRTINTVEADK